MLISSILKIQFSYTANIHCMVEIEMKNAWEEEERTAYSEITCRSDWFDRFVLFTYSGCAITLIY